MRTERADTLFKVLADPTRRRMLDLLAGKGPLSVGQLAAAFPDLVASGISKHLMGLRAAGLVKADRDGRQRIYSLNAKAVTGTLQPWLSKYERYAEAALERLREAAEDDQADR
ncbi:MAG: helix-turn-helix transcriptional regulator [Proteobacteria bacterium]|nr:helix-turn-helix transcriptional regulator [Pseudomonadota bacterium]